MTRHTCCCCLSKLKAAFIYLLSLVLCGCSTPQVIGKFQGLKTIQQGTEHLHIILVHGIKKQEPGWSGNFYQELEASLNKELEPPHKLQQVGDDNWEKCIFIKGDGLLGDLTQCKVSDVPTTADGVLKTVTLKSSDGTKTVTITEVTWSPITTALKQKLLEYDKTNDLSKQRAWINRWLREGLVDDGFSDALAYAGEPGARIRDVVWKAICYSMTGKLEGSAACDLGKDKDRFAFITHSLGSRIVFDALHVGKEERNLAEKNVSLMQKITTIDRVSAKTVALYMLANQLPLLEMAGVPDDKVTSVTTKIQNADGTMSLLEEKDASATQASSLISRFMDDRRNAFPRMKALNLFAEEQEPPPVSIAAFSDPNDLLSYSLRTSGMINSPNVDVADIWVGNAINFGVFANPMSAHQDYWVNKDVIELLIDGAEEGKNKCGAL